MKRVLPLIMLGVLASCSGETQKVHTVDELLADEPLLAKVLGECRNNPGERGSTPTCQNAESADGKLRLERMRQSLGG